MLKFRDTIVHQRQTGPSNCGPVALQCVFDAPIEEIEKIVNCRRSGTNCYDAAYGLKEHGIECNLVRLDTKDENPLWWISTCCYRWPIYASCTFVNQGKRGRPSKSHHAVLFANGMCYDGNDTREAPIESIALKFNKKFTINAVIVIAHELKDWKKNMENS